MKKCKGCSEEIQPCHNYKAKRFCTTACFRSWRASPKGIIERFWSKVEFGDDCWIFKGCIGHEGYGSYAHGEGPTRAQYQAHRFAWFAHHGEHPPKDLAVCHRCDNRSCVRPDHLFLGTWKDNMHDMLKKDRQTLCTLTHEQVRAVRSLLGTKLQKEIAKEFGVKEGVISDLKRGYTYQHVPQEPSSFAAGEKAK